MNGERAGEKPAAFDRSAASEVWCNTLSQIPSLFGRLVYLSSLRNSNNGKYEHHGLALVVDQDKANRTLKRAHAALFAEWLTLSLENNKADLDLYLAGLNDDKRVVIKTWVRLASYENLIPATAREPERRLYMSIMTALLELYRKVYAVALESEKDSPPNWVADVKGRFRRRAPKKPVEGHASG